VLNQTDDLRMLTLPVMPMKVEPVTLDGRYMRLEPLSMEHYAGLCEALLDEDLWRWIFVPVKTPDEMHTFIEKALSQCPEGHIIPFAAIYKPTNRVVGTTRYMAIDRMHHHVDIGTTVIAKQWQRTIVNTEVKYLMLRYAFETIGCLRVEFQTDSLNIQSQNALLRLGARREGVLRNHRICADGRVRHTIVFSITDEEWPTTKVNLEAKLKE
jgi:RimJ/RimL family protein N-acetyltransferase